MNIDNSPKIHFVKNKEGKFYNARLKIFESNVIHGSYERDFKIANAYLGIERFKDCEVFTMTELEFLENLASKTTNVVLSGSYFAEQLKELGFKLPTISQVGKTMYQKCKSALETLTPFTKMHIDFISKQEDKTDEVRGCYEEFISEACKVQIFQTAEVTALLKAYQLDRKSSMGMAKKILRLNNIDVVWKE